MLSIPIEPIVLNADPTRLTQVLVNLLDNAARYTEPGGTIDLSVMVENDDVVFRVKDTGIGISAEMLSQVFDIFTQIANSSDGTQHGLGIGLSLVKTLVQLHGGTVEANSDGLGRGTVFTIRLPVGEAFAC